eukprot:874127-Rhodomonas_salina.1
MGAPTDSEHGSSYRVTAIRYVSTGHRTARASADAPALAQYRTLHRKAAAHSSGDAVSVPDMAEQSVGMERRCTCALRICCGESLGDSP